MREKLDENLFWDDDLLYTYSPIYLPINLEVKFKYVALGLNHVAAITTTNKAYTWGKNTEGQLGIGNKFQNIIND